MPHYAGLVKLKGSRSQEEELAAGQAALDLAKEEAVGSAMAAVSGTGYINMFWTQGNVDLFLMFMKPNQEAAAEFTKKLEQRQNSEIRLIHVMTEGEKERDIAGKPRWNSV
jgi:hypothetical protein